MREAPGFRDTGTKGQSLQELSSGPDLVFLSADCLAWVTCLSCGLGVWDVLIAHLIRQGMLSRKGGC